MREIVNMENIGVNGEVIIKTDLQEVGLNLDYD
jgi:hypothetical protein